MGSARFHVAVGLAFALSLGGAARVVAQSTPPAEPPADWAATAIDYSNVRTPIP